MAPTELYALNYQLSTLPLLSHFFELLAEHRNVTAGWIPGELNPPRFRSGNAIGLNLAIDCFEGSGGSGSREASHSSNESLLSYDGLPARIPSTLMFSSSCGQ